MSPKELYKILDNAGIEYEVIEIFEGTRIIQVMIEEVKSEDD